MTGGTFPAKLLKSSPFILIFKDLQQVSQGHPSFPMKAGVDLTLAPLSAQGDPPSVVDMWRPATVGPSCRLQNYQSFLQRSKFHWLGHSNASVLPRVFPSCFSFYLVHLTQTCSCTPSYPPKALHLLPTSLSFLEKSGCAKTKKKKCLGEKTGTVQEPSLYVPGRKHEFKKRAK